MWTQKPKGNEKRQTDKQQKKKQNGKWNDKPKYSLKIQLLNEKRKTKKAKQKKNKIKNTSLFRFGVCGVVMLLIVCEFVVDVVMIASFSVSVEVDVELVDVSDSFDFCSGFVALFG